MKKINLRTLTKKTSTKFGTIFFVILFLFAISSCEKDKPEENFDFTNSFINGVFILNEGNFNSGNSSLSYYNLKTGNLSDDVFMQANSYKLGDIAQSISKINNMLFIVVNNSNKIEVVDAYSLKKLFTITGFVSPRYCAQVATDKLYVTDLFSDSIAIVRLSDGIIYKKIACKGWTEQLVVVNDKVFVTNVNTANVYVFDADTDALIDSINVGYAPNSICLDGDNNVWAASYGNSLQNIKATVTKIDSKKFEVLQSFELANAASAICANDKRDKIYFLSKGVFEIEKSATTLSSSPFIAETGYSFYGLAVMPNTGDLFLSDAIDYIQRGNVIRYTNTGEKVTEFKAGIIPSSFYFQ